MTESLLLLLPLGLAFLGIAIGLLLWSIYSGQYEDISQANAHTPLESNPPDTHRNE
jgi:cbb3-type cytochrome oxidase maturation protein